MQAERDYYFTTGKPFRADELKVKGSRFIADIFPTSSKEEIENYLAGIRKEFYDATHHCYAYRFGIYGEHVRAADDGEPSGTAGKPILLALSAKELTNVLLIVTRYYGGTNLGTGGLSRAYYEAATMAVTGATHHIIYLTETFILNTGYEEIDLVERFLRSYGADYDSDFGEKVTIKTNIRKSLSEQFKEEIRNKFYDRVTLL